MALLAAVTALATAGIVGAWWSAGSAPGGGRADAASLGTGATPSVSLISRTATVSWAQQTIGGIPLGQLAGGGYTVQRYAAAAPGTSITPLAACVGTISGAADPLSCDEAALPTGRWLYTVTPTFWSWVGGPSAQSAYVAVAPDAPTSVSLVNGGGIGSAYINTANQTSLSYDVVLPPTSLATDTVTLLLGDGSTTVTVSLAGITGGGTRSFTGIDVSALLDGPITASATATSADGDSSSPASSVNTKDTAAPSGSLALTGVSPAGSALLTGSSVMYRGAGGGSLALQNTVSDGGSGPGSSTTTALAGSSSGWAHSPSTVSTPALGPYVSNAFTWSAGTSSSPTETVISADAAGNTSSALLGFVNDSTAPTGGSITANGAATYNSSGSITLVKTDFGEVASATESGLASNVVTRASATLSGDSCGSFSGSTVVTISGGLDPADLATGCYQYTLTGTDNVGNIATAVSTVVKVDRTAPDAPTLTLSNATGAAYYPGSGSIVFFRPSATGSFDLAASSSDPDTGIASLNFPSPLAAGWTTAGSGGSRTYSFSAGASPPGTQSVTATNNAGTTGAGSTFTINADSTAPTGGALTVNGTAASGGGTTSSNTSGSFSINVRTDFTEAPSGTASGLASSVLTRASATLSGGACGSFGSPVVLVGTPAQTGLAVGCYRYVLTGTDNVGNQVTLTTTVTVNPSPPVITSVTNVGASGKVKVNGTGNAAGGTITVVICATSAFPCSGANIIDGTLSAPAGATWTTGNSVVIGTGTFWAQATQDGVTSTPFSFLH